MPLRSFPDIYALTGRTVLGVNPPILDFAWFDLWAKPAGLLSVLGWLRSRGNRVFLLDCLQESRTKALTYGRWKVSRTEAAKPGPYQAVPRRFYRFGLGPEETADRLRQFPRPDVILVTSIMTYWYLGVWETVRRLKEIFPGVPVVLGGIYAALCPEHAALSGADHLLLPDRPPRWPLTPLDLYDRPGYAVLATSRGCPRRCGYCASARLNPGYHHRELQAVIADLDHQMAPGSVTDLAFYDDALLNDPQRVFYPLLRHLRTRYPGLRLHTPNGLSVAQIDEPCARALKAAGFQTLRLSFEGLDRHVRAAGADKAAPGAYESAVANLRRAGYAPEALETYLLAGLPGQRAEDVARSIDYVRSAGARPKLGEFSPIPGTRLFQAARGQTPEIAREPLWHNNTVYTPYLSKTIGPEELQALKNLCRGPEAVPGAGQGEAT